MAILCEKTGADVEKVMDGIGFDKRIGRQFLYPGIGYGGSCFPKDVKALAKTAHEHGYKMQILEAVESVNDFQKSVLFTKIKKHFGSLNGKHFAMWGLAFKPKTDDMREAPSLVIIDKLLAEGATVTAYDPVAMHEAKKTLGNSITYATSQYEALNDADALLIVTEWPEFRSPKFEEMGSRLKHKVIFDGRNIYEPEEMAEYGFSYECIGRAKI